MTPTSNETMSPSFAAVVARDAVDDHLVRRDARRGREALVALRGRDAAVRADVVLGDPVELGHRDARLEPLLACSASVPATTSPARAISSISCALLRMITRASSSCSSASWISTPDLVDRAVGVQRDELAGRRGSARRPARSPRGRSSSRRAITSGVSSGRFSSPRAPSMPLGGDVVRQVEEEDRVERRGRSRASISSSASACARLRGKPSSTKPSRASSLVEPLADQRRPSARRARARPRRGSARPAGRARVRAAIAARNMSPVETCGIP